MSRVVSKKTLPFGKYITLSDGNKIPQLGFGVYEVSGSTCKQTVLAALKAGYRHIDSAEWYGNEKPCGQAILEFIAGSNGQIKREDIFFTTKLMSSSTYQHAQQAIRKSVKECGLGYLDMYLLHSPYPSKSARLESWKACEEAREAGLIHSIGVSNFGVRHLRELLDREGADPVVNQIDVHPFMTRSDDVLFNESNQISVEAWGPLARGEKMQDETLKNIAKTRGKSVAQCMIRWSLQRGFICIPKSVTPHRILENCDVFDFELTPQEVQRMNALDEYLVTILLFLCFPRIIDISRSLIGIPLGIKESDPAGTL